MKRVMSVVLIVLASALISPALAETIVASFTGTVTTVYGVSPSPDITVDTPVSIEIEYDPATAVQTCCPGTSVIAGYTFQQSPTNFVRVSIAGMSFQSSPGSQLRAGMAINEPSGPDSYNNALAFSANLYIGPGLPPGVFIAQALAYTDTPLVPPIISSIALPTSMDGINMGSAQQLTGVYGDGTLNIQFDIDPASFQLGPATNSSERKVFGPANEPSLAADPFDSLHAVVGFNDRRSSPSMCVSVRGSPPSLSCRADRDYRFGLPRARSWREGNSDAGSGRGESRAGEQAVCRWPRTAASTA